jgi:hypothetical protein
MGAQSLHVLDPAEHDDVVDRPTRADERRECGGTGAPTLRRAGSEQDEAASRLSLASDRRLPERLPECVRPLQALATRCETTGDVEQPPSVGQVTSGKADLNPASDPDVGFEAFEPALLERLTSQVLGGTPFTECARLKVLVGGCQLRAYREGGTRRFADIAELAEAGTGGGYA